MADREERDERPAVDPLRVVTLVLLAAMVLVVFGLSIYLVTYVREQRETAECYQTAFDELNASLAVSREAARQDRAQLRTLVTSFTNPDSTREQARAALASYVAALDEADEQRLRAPLPSRNCG